MKTFFTLLGREVKSFLYSPIAYVVLCCFLFMAGFNFYSQIQIMNGYPTEVTIVEAYFMPALFWFPFVLSFPLITMRVYSEEFRMGTFETLTTAPVKDWQVVLSKFFGVFVFYILLWMPCFLCFAAFKYIMILSEPNPAGAPWWSQMALVFTDHGVAVAHSAGSYWGTFLLLMLLGSFFISIGCLASALTKDQINAAAISFIVIVLLLFLGFIPDIMGLTAPAIKDIFSYVSSIQHMQDFSKGIIDSRPIVWYLSMTVLMSYLTLQIFQFRKWKS
jgi:ABC-2 type transport system permease protein